MLLLKLKNLKTRLKVKSVYPLGGHFSSTYKNLFHCEIFNTFKSYVHKLISLRGLIMVFLGFGISSM